MNNNSLTSLQSAPMGERAPYVAPSIEIIDVVTEGVIAGSFNTSGGLPGFGDGGGAYSNRRSNYGGASTSDIEDMLNDILTIKQSLCGDKFLKSL